MADTRADINLVPNDWVDAYSLSGIAVGTALVIVNKSSKELLIQVKATKPSANNIDGVPLEPYEEATLDASESGCWLRGKTAGRVSVQEA